GRRRRGRRRAVAGAARLRTVRHLCGHAGAQGQGAPARTARARARVPADAGRGAVMSAAGADNFNLIRLAAAWLVLFSHSYHLSGFGAVEPLLVLSGGKMTLGTLAVGVF